MVPQKIVHYLNRLKSMGLRTAGVLTCHRLRKQLFLQKAKRRWQKGKSYHAWHNISAQPFGTLYTNVCDNDFCPKMLADPSFISMLPPAFNNPAMIYARADQAVRPCISILGYGTWCFDQGIAWHTDVTTTNPSTGAWRTGFGGDISATVKKPSSQHHQSHLPDIKVPWELSRLQHLFHLGLGYQQATLDGDTHRAQSYTQAFTQQTSDWIERNPFMHGVAWCNPMEVAIRAINLMWAWSFFKHNPDITMAWWEHYFCVLHDHAWYLEHTWEISDKPNNHYLADLVGYVYVSSLFMNIKKTANKRTKIIATTIEQWFHQTLPDGWCYEGSTSYHRLDTELLMHFIGACTHTNTPLPGQLIDRYQSMVKCLRDCADVGGKLAQIGDNDSGIIVTGIHITPSLPQPTPRITSYKHCGLSIIQAPRWHITLRHPTYAPHQPTGHFHQDFLSVTISIDGLPLFVDPGTGVYTANPIQRNYFRSVYAHNTFCPQSTLLPAGDLFQLARMPHPWAARIDHTQSYIQVEDYHHEYETICGTQAHRRLIFNHDQQRLTIIDWWSPAPVPTQWALHCAHDIIIQQESSYAARLYHDNQPIAVITTSTAFTISSDSISTAYGNTTPATTLVAQYDGKDPMKTTIQLLER